MDNIIKKRIVRIVLLAIVALTLSIALVVYKNETSTAPKGSSPVAGLSIGGAYDLVDDNGNPRSDQDFKGVYKLIYFGFTYCPAICPTELSKITSVMNALPPETAAQIQPLFITIDPERDTVPVMHDYVSLFHEKLIGLTGTPAQIDAVKQTYRIYAKKVQDENLNDYTMDHSSYIYLMSPDDTLLSIYRTKDTPADMIAEITDVLG